MQEFTFDAKYRTSDEYYNFCQCLKAQGVDEMMWDYCIMLHKSNPTLYKTEKRKNTSTEDLPQNKVPKVFDSVEVLPPPENISVVAGDAIP